MTTVIGILLIVMAVFLVIAVLMQSSKDHRSGGVVAGGAETFFGKTKGKSMDALFNKLTTVIAIIFVLLVVVLYVIQPEAVVEEGYVAPIDGEVAENVEVEEVEEIELPSEEVEEVEVELPLGDVVDEAAEEASDVVAE